MPDNKKVKKNYRTFFGFFQNIIRKSDAATDLIKAKKGVFEPKMRIWYGNNGREKL